VNVAEVQDTFYHPLPLRTAHSLRREAPSAFEFTIRAWLLITHDPGHPNYRHLRFTLPEERKPAFGSFRDTDEVWAAWAKTDEVAQALRSRAILFRTPGAFKATTENIGNLRRFFGRIDRRDYLLAWEPRGNWPAEVLATVCAELDLTHVVDPFVARSRYGRRRYFRLNGMGEDRRRYGDEELDKLAALLRKHPGAYCIFSNHHRFEDAPRLAGRLAEAPPLPDNAGPA
jgi:uncharacterized protein YecE (DUF72 family)